MVTKTRRTSLNRDRVLWAQIGSAPATTTSSRGVDAWTDSVTGVQNPRWRAQVARHVSATTPLSGQLQKVQGDVNVLAYIDYQSNIANPDHTKKEYRGIAYLGTLAAPSTSLTVDNAYNTALINFYQDARSKIRFIESGVFLGELAEVLHMIRNPAKVLRRRIDEYAFLARQRARIPRGARSDPASRRRHVDRAISNTWLEASFGWRPLMGDIESGAQALAESVNRFRGQFESAHGHGFDDAFLGSESEILQIPSPNGNSDIRYRCSTVSVAQASVRIKGQVAIEVDNPLLLRAELFGFSLSDFAPTAWELIPYSFLVDYFTNIGDLISSWTFPNKRIKWTNVSSLLLRKKSVEGYMIDPNTYKVLPSKVHVWHGSPLRYLCETRTVERGAGTLGLPYGRFQIPGLSLKWLNIAGLARVKRLPGTFF